MREYEVERIAPYKSSHLLKLKGVEGLAQADALAGFDILVPEAAVRPAEEGTIYDLDLVDCAVELEDGRPVGRVVGVQETGGTAFLVIAGPDAGEEILVPLSAAICRLIDTAGKRIVIDPPDGLLDLNAI
jgi:16S rRNA processing protein RimM